MNIMGDDLYKKPEKLEEVAVVPVGPDTKFVAKVLKDGESKTVPVTIINPVDGSNQVIGEGVLSFIEGEGLFMSGVVTDEAYVGLFGLTDKEKIGLSLVRDDIAEAIDRQARAYGWEAAVRGKLAKKFTGVTHTNPFLCDNWRDAITEDVHPIDAPPQRLCVTIVEHYLVAGGEGHIVTSEGERVFVSADRLDLRNKVATLLGDKVHLTVRRIERDIRDAHLGPKFYLTSIKAVEL